MECRLSAQCTAVSTSERLPFGNLDAVEFVEGSLRDVVAVDELPRIAEIVAHPLRQIALIFGNTGAPAGFLEHGVCACGAAA